MKLKRVEIIGFKSFAEKTVIEFHDGITCIVGPNGCGKSNIGDAIRWVLGEQSAKALRGGKMPDVIFAGAASKKPLNFAEVTIHFTEIEGSLPLDYEEIAVSRRLYRSGESEYFINKELVRLKDVHALFLDSGIGKNNFSFFEQGKIDQLIQYSPEERRYIFEEAAGIVRFLQRKRETMRKLEDASLNLSRVADIQTEVEKQVANLEGQALAAAEYKEKRASLEAYEKELLFLRYRGFIKKHADLAEKETIARKSVETASLKKEALEQGLTEKKDIYDQLEQKYLFSREERLGKERERELKEQARTHTEERIQDFSRKEEKVGLELISIAEKLKGWNPELDALKKKREALSLELAQAKGILKIANDAYHSLDQELQTLRSKQTAAYRGKTLALERQSSLQNEVKQLKFRLDSNLEKQELLQERSQQLAIVIQEKEGELERRLKAKDEAVNKLTSTQEQLKDAERRLKEADQTLLTSQHQLQECIKEFQEKSAKLNALMHLRQEFTGFSLGSKQLLKETQEVGGPLFGLLKGLYEYITPKKGQERAVSEILKRYAETLVVEKKTQLDAVMHFAKTKELTGFSIVCLETIQENGFLSPYALENILSSHFLHQVTPWGDEGCFLDAKGVLFVPGKGEASIFLREAEIKSLEEELRTIALKKDEKEAEVSVKKEQEQALKAERLHKDQEVRRAEMAKMEEEFHFQKAESDCVRTQKERRQVEEEIQGILAFVGKALQEQEKADGAFKEASLGFDRTKEELNAVEKELNLKSQQQIERKNELLKADEGYRALEAEYRKTSHSYLSLEAKVQESLRLQERLLKDLESGRSSKEEWLAASMKARTDLEVLKEACGKAAESAQVIEKEKSVAKDAIIETEKQLKELLHELKEWESKVHQLGIQLAHVETGQNTVLQELEDRFQSVPEEPSMNLAMDKMEKEVRVLKEYLASHQNVNLAAIEECDRQKERALFLKEQVADLETAKESLLQMIRGLDQESRHLFKTTFEEIRRNFQKNFQILFQGGEADLELLEAEDILDAGVEISAKPPGKQMRSLSLLSGGEKCLTAMALLFAIFEVKSAPFCILDEIDAPLDDSNVERFLNVVKQFIDRCQFIIVTHNKRTMALADRLYGVSMEEKGISKLLFMEFSGKSTQLVGV